MVGRKPKPTSLKLLTGNPGKRRLNKREPTPTRVIPSPPGHLTARALTAWGSLAARLDRMALLTEADAEALEVLCEQYAEIIDLRADVTTKGRFQAVTTTAGDVVDRPRAQYTALCAAEQRFRVMMCEFGLTPSSRVRVNAHPDDDRDTDPAAQYFG